MDKEPTERELLMQILEELKAIKTDVALTKGYIFNKFYPELAKVKQDVETEDAIRKARMKIKSNEPKLSTKTKSEMSRV